MALSSCVQDVIWFRALSQEICPNSIKGPTKIFCDNMGAIHISNNEVISQKCKHIAIRYHFFKDHIKNNEIKILHIPTENMLADPMTKSLPRPKFQESIKNIGLL